VNIFIANLDYQLQEAELQQAFEEFGEVSSAKIITDKLSGRSKGYGFVEMPNDEEGLAAINSLNESEINGRKVVVKKAKPKEENDRSRRGGGYQNRERY
jgi:RNA recognition motif-containing protein